MAIDSLARPKFRLRDGLFLVAAIAIGFAASKQFLNWYELNPYLHSGGDRYGLFVNHTLLLVAPTLIACSTAVFLLAAIRARAALGRLSRRPGFMANAGGLAGVAVSFISIIFTNIFDYFYNYYQYNFYFDRILLEFLMFACAGRAWCFVLGATLPSALRREWLPRRDWLDRIGWLLGSIWIMLALQSFVRRVY